MGLLRHLTPLVAVAALAACADDPIAPQPPPPPPIDAPLRLVETEFWAGNPVTLVSAAFARPDSVVVEVGDQVLTPERLNDSTIRVVLPNQAGSVAPVVVIGATRRPMPSITVHGRVGLIELGFRFEDGVLVGPNDASTPGAFGVARQQGKLWFTMVDLATGDTRFDDYLTPPISGSAIRPPGPTRQPNEFVFFTQDGTAETWRLTNGAPVLVQRHEEAPLPGANYSYRQLTYLGDVGWWRLEKNIIVAFPGPGYQGDGAQIPRVDDAFGLVMDPTGSRAIPVGGYTSGRTMVLNATTGGVAYFVEGVGIAHGAAFTADGVRLAVVGGANPIAASGGIAVLDAATGNADWETPLTVSSRGVAWDQSRGRVYAAGVEPGTDAMVVAVLDAADGRVLATLRTGDAEVKCHPNSSMAMAVTSNRRLHVLCTPHAPSQRLASIWQFSVP